MDNTITQKPGWLFVLPWSLREIGGVNQVVENLILCFREASEFVPCLLVTTRDTKNERIEVPETIEHFSLDLQSPVDARHPVRAFFSFVCRFRQRYKALRRILVHKNIRVINQHFPSLNAIMFIVLKKCGRFEGQIILSFHGSDVKAAMSATGLEKFLWKVVLRQVDQIAIVSNSLGIELRALEPRIADKLTTIYNGVALEPFAASNPDSNTSLQESDKTETIISIGSFRTLKATMYLSEPFRW